MARLGLDRLFAFVSHCHGALDREGLHVEQVHHPNDAKRAAAALDATHLSRRFDPDWSDLSQSTAFWLLIYYRSPRASAARRLVGIIGARIDDLAPGEFTPSLTHRMNRLYGADGTAPLLAGPTPPVFGKISGRVASISDLCLAPDFRGEGPINLRALLLLVFAYARTEWDFDWLYAFIAKDHAAQGYLATYCFANTHPAALEWSDASERHADTGVFGCLARADFLYLVELVTRRPRLLDFA